MDFSAPLCAEMPRLAIGSPAILSDRMSAATRRLVAICQQRSEISSTTRPAFLSCFVETREGGVMDWNLAIEKNREALKRVLAALVAMMAMADGSMAKTLPRRLHRAVLRLLRPAESAVRRLVIAAARGIVVKLPPSNAPPILKPGVARLAVTRSAFPLHDALRTPCSVQTPARSAVLPRIWVMGSDRLPTPRLPTSDDPVDATRLGLRLQALRRVLENLQGQAQRFARWRARLDRMDRTRANPRRFRRLSPLKPGYPPGARRPSSRGSAHEVHAILRDLHGLAFWALEKPDTS